MKNDLLQSLQTTFMGSHEWGNKFSSKILLTILNYGCDFQALLQSLAFLFILCPNPVLHWLILVLIVMAFFLYNDGQFLYFCFISISLLFNQSELHFVFSCSSLLSFPFLFFFFFFFFFCNWYLSFKFFHAF